MVHTATVIGIIASWLYTEEWVFLVKFYGLVLRISILGLRAPELLSETLTFSLLQEQLRLYCRMFNPGQFTVMLL